MEKGQIYTFTEIFSPPESFKSEAPYSCGIVENEQGQRFPVCFSGDTRAEKLYVGCPVVHTGNRESGIPVYSVLDQE